MRDTGPETGLGVAQQARRERYADFNAVIEISEFERHLLVECFFRSAAADSHIIERLLFQYRLALERIVASGADAGYSAL